MEDDELPSDPTPHDLYRRIAQAELSIVQANFTQRRIVKAIIDALSPEDFRKVMAVMDPVLRDILAEPPSDKA